MSVAVLPAGDAALLLAPADPADLPGLVDVLRGSRIDGVVDVLPAAETVLVTLDAGADPAGVERNLRGALAADRTRGVVSDRFEEIRIPVRYDGADLPEVARLLGVGVEEVIAEHTRREWRCRFIGFTAGFGYLETSEPGLVVPRRSRSRTAVPAGSVALADGYSAVYPRRSPGGWQLIGTTDVPMWDLDRPQPALLAPGARVRFVRVQ